MNYQEIFINPVTKKEQKYCSTCGKLKLLPFFPESPRCISGHRDSCKLCQSSKYKTGKFGRGVNLSEVRRGRRKTK